MRNLMQLTLISLATVMFLAWGTGANAGGSANLLINPGFEEGKSGWGWNASGIDVIIYAPGGAHGGNWYAWLGNYGAEPQSLYQDVEITASATSAQVIFWYAVRPKQSLSGASDTLTATINDPSTGAVLATLDSFSNLNETSVWTQSSVLDVSAFIGRKIRLVFSATTLSEFVTNFYLDDVSVTVSLAAAPCRYSLNAVNAAFSSLGGTGNISISTSDPSCVWNGTSPQSWISILSGSDSGSGTILYSVSANSTGQGREGTITIGDTKFTIRQSKTHFFDVADSNIFYAHIYGISAKGIVDGYGDGRFNPSGQLTQEQAAKVIIKAIEGEPPLDYCQNGSSFSDVQTSDWSCRYIKRLVEKGITTGCGPNRFCPTDPVTREQMAAFIIRAYEGEPYDQCTDSSSFSDVAKDQWSCKYIKRLKEKWVTTGCGPNRFCPTDPVTREQMAAFIYQAFIEDQYIISGTLGPTGGTLEGGGLSVTVPPGALTDNTELDIIVQTDSNPFGYNLGSKLYRIRGLPADFSLPITFKVQHQGSLSGTPFVTVGRDSFVTSAASSLLSYQLIDATDEGGYLTAQLPPPSGGHGNSSAAFAAPGKEAKPAPGVYIGVVHKYGTELSSKGNFRIIYSNDLWTVCKTGDYLESALEYFISTRLFSEVKTKRTEWPVDVYIIPLKYDALSVRNWGVNSGYININETLLANNACEAIQIAVPHELFHFIQDLYDSRYWPSRAWIDDPALWIKEASATMAEDFLIDTTPTNFQQYHEQAYFLLPSDLKRTAFRDTTNQARHGYGISAFFKYLESNVDPNYLKEIFTCIETGLAGTPEDCLMSAVTSNSSSPFETHWMDYLRSFMRGDIYSQNAQAHLTNEVLSGTYPVNDSGASYKIRESYDRFFSRLYYFPMKYKLPSNEGLLVQVNDSASSGKNGYMYVFKTLKGDRDIIYGLELLNNNPEKSEVVLPSKLADGSDIVVLVMNVSNNYVLLELDIDVIKPNIVSPSVQLAANYSTGIRHTSFQMGGQFPMPCVVEPSLQCTNSLTWNGNSFSGSYVLQYEYNIKNSCKKTANDPEEALFTYFSEGSLQGTLNAAWTEVENISFTFSTLHTECDGRLKVKELGSFQALSLPPKESGRCVGNYLCFEYEVPDNYPRETFVAHVPSFAYSTESTLDGQPLDPYSSFSVTSYDCTKRPSDLVNFWCVASTALGWTPFFK